MMVYEKVPIEAIDFNPFQLRQESDMEKIAEIAESALGEHGILQAPMVRKTGERYQIAFGHSRILAMKALGEKEVMCRVEDMTDAQMRKYVLLENTLRTDLTRTEIMDGLEAFRENPDTGDSTIDTMLKNKKYGWISELARRTHLNEKYIREQYDVHEIIQLIQQVRPGSNLLETKFGLIRNTAGLEEPDRIALVHTALRGEWSRDVTYKVKQAMPMMSEEVKKYLIYDGRRKTPPSVIIALSELPEEQQYEVALHLKTLKIDEEGALRIIERVKSGDIIKETKIIDEEQECIDKFSKTLLNAKLWGINEYMILQNTRWAEAKRIFKEIELHMQWLLREGFLEALADDEP